MKKKMLAVVLAAVMTAGCCSQAVMADDGVVIF